MTTIDELLKFPCDYVFKVFGDNQRGEQFQLDVLAAVSETIPIGLDSLRQRNSSGGKYICLSVLVMAESRSQLEAIYCSLQQVEGLRYLL